MKDKAESEELFVGYLLGELPEEEQTRLEEVFFADDGYFEQLLVAEDELRYDYVQGLLDQQRRERFARRFASTARDRQRLGFATALVSTLTEKGAEAGSPKPHDTTLLFTAVSPSLIDAWPRRLNPRGRLTRLTTVIAQSKVWRPRPLDAWRRLRVRDRVRPISNITARYESKKRPPRPLTDRRERLAVWARSPRLAFVSVVIILLSALAIIIAETIRYQNLAKKLSRELGAEKGYLAQTEQERNRARALAEQLEIERSRRLMLEEDLNKRANQTGQKWEPTVAASFILSPAAAGGSGEFKKPLIQPGDAERVRLQLHLKKAGEYQTYQALLKTAEGKLVWGQAGLRPSRLGPIRVVALILPAKLVPPGDYHVELKGIAPGREAEAVDDYYVSVAKR